MLARAEQADADAWATRVDARERGGDVPAGPAAPLSPGSSPRP